MFASIQQTAVILNIADYVGSSIDEDPHICVFHGDLPQHPFIGRGTILRPRSILPIMGR